VFKTNYLTRPKRRFRPVLDKSDLGYSCQNRRADDPREEGAIQDHFQLLVPDPQAVAT
jgi:hypothetical protein